jgi:hypothetical protein
MVNWILRSDLYAGGVEEEDGALPVATAAVPALRAPAVLQTLIVVTVVVAAVAAAHPVPAQPPERGKRNPCRSLKW